MPEKETRDQSSNPRCAENASLILDGSEDLQMNIFLCLFLLIPESGFQLYVDVLALYCI